jgi:methylmalonyl-CoA mutase N-terminal domain/subunit
MIRKDLKHIQLENQQEQDHTGISDAGVNTTEFVTAEGIELNKHILAKDIENLKHLDLRHVDQHNVRSTTMDRKAICGFSTAEESNAFTEEILRQDKKGLSCI